MLTEVICKEVVAVMETHVNRMVQESTRSESKKVSCQLHCLMSLLLYFSQGELMKLLQSQQYNAAFELVLSTSDLQLVTYLCQQMDPDELFEKSPCLLTQPVLLSLIQQLSVNLEENLELKLRCVCISM